MQIAGVEIPTWALVAGGAGVAFVLLKNGNGGGTTTESDTSTSLLAAELDQRLKEQWEAWQAWLEEYLNSGSGPVNPPGGDIECKVNTDCPSPACGYGKCVAGKCMTVETPGGCGGNPRTDPGTCRDGYYWDGYQCRQSPVTFQGPPTVIPITPDPGPWTYPEVPTIIPVVTPLVQPVEQPTTIGLFDNPVVFENV